MHAHSKIFTYIHTYVHIVNIDNAYKFKWFTHQNIANETNEYEC